MAASVKEAVGKNSVTINVDGRDLEARKGAMLIEITDRAGIYIPRFCYHERLSVAANCRMCLVEVEKAPKPLPACATPVMDGMVVRTRSKFAAEAQKATMEFLLINHPLDCPICDQGGECELQDLAMGYGSDVSRYTERKRVVADKNIGPLVQTDMTRCIHCTRCVRFGEEIAGLRELGATGRGEDMEIGTYVEKAMVSELSGNVIDLCPVGALTSKPYRYSARAWELREYPSVAGHDAVGSAIAVHAKGRVAKRVVPRTNEAVNEVWISDRDRFSYEGLNHEQRARAPVGRAEDGTWRELDWDEAFERLAAGLAGCLEAHGPEKLGALVSPSASVEEAFLAQKLLRGLGSGNIDHRLRWADFRDEADSPGLPWLGMPIAALEQVDAALVVGTHLRSEQPLLNHRLRKAAMAGAPVWAVNPRRFPWNFGLAGELAAGGDGMLAILAAVADALELPCPAALPRSTAGQAGALAAALRQAERPVCIVGALAHAHPSAALIRRLAGRIAEATGAVLAVLPEGGNGAGVALAGAEPRRGPGLQPAAPAGMNLAEMQGAGMKALLTLGVDTDHDCLDAAGMRAMLEQAEFVACLGAYDDEALRSRASLILPIALYPENEGSFVNAELRRQRFAPAIPAPGEARPAWKVLRLLGERLGLEGFDYVAVDDVAAEISVPAGAVPALSGSGEHAYRPLEEDGAQLVPAIAPHAVDAMVRHARALQQTPGACDERIHLSPAQAAALGVEDGDAVELALGELRLSAPAAVDEHLEADQVSLRVGGKLSARLRGWYGPAAVVRKA